MSEILYDRYKNEYGEASHRNVTRLSITGVEHDYEYVDELHVKQHPTSVVLVRFHETKKPRQFELTDAELDALIEARIAFKANVTEFEANEKARLDAEIAQAKALVESVRSSERPWTLEFNEQANRYTLDCAHPTLVGEFRRETLIYSMQAERVLGSVKNYLIQKELIKPEPTSVATDEYDPFVDGDEMP